MVPKKPSARALSGHVADLASAGVVRAARPPAPASAQLLPPHGLAHAPLGGGAGLDAVGAVPHARGDPPVARGAPEELERGPDARAEGLIVPPRPRESAPRVLVGALRYPKVGHDPSEGEPVVPPQPLSQLGLTPVRESHRVSCFWVAEHLPQRHHLEPEPVELAGAGPGPRGRARPSERATSPLRLPSRSSLSASPWCPPGSACAGGTCPRRSAGRAPARPRARPPSPRAATSSACARSGGSPEPGGGRRYR